MNYEIEDTLNLALAERIPYELRQIVKEKIPNNRSADYYQGLHDFCLTASELLGKEISIEAKAQILGAFLLETQSKIAGN